MKLKTPHVKLEIEGQDTVITENYDGLTLKNAVGNQLTISERDDTFELIVKPKDGESKFVRVDMQRPSLRESGAIAWLIELVNEQDDPTGVALGLHGSQQLWGDYDKALRFAREEDAAAFARKYASLDPWIITEHSWCA